MTTNTELMTLEQAREWLRTQRESHVSLLNTEVPASSKTMRAIDALLAATAPCEVDEAEEDAAFEAKFPCPKNTGALFYYTTTKMMDRKIGWLAAKRHAASAGVQPNLACKSVQKRLAAQWGLIHPDDVRTCAYPECAIAKAQDSAFEQPQPASAIRYSALEEAAECADAHGWPEAAEHIREGLIGLRQPSTASVSGQGLPLTAAAYLDQVEGAASRDWQQGWDACREQMLLAQQPASAQAEPVGWLYSQPNGAEWFSRRNPQDLDRDSMSECEVSVVPLYAGAHPPATSREVPEVPDARQLASACFSYRHDYGLLTDDERDQLRAECRQWWKAIAREINEPSCHPMILAAAQQLEDGKP